MNQPNRTSYRRIAPLALALVCGLLTSPALADGPHGPPRLQATAPSRSQLLTTNELLATEADRLSAAIRADAGHQLIRIAYEKSRLLERALADRADILTELRVTESTLDARIRVDRQIHALRAQQSEARRTTNLLKTASR